MANPKVLLVEGNEDLYAVAQLMGHHIAWPDKKKDAPVRLEQHDGIEKLLDKPYISSLLKASLREVAILGVMIDADDEFEARWTALRSYCLDHFPDLPEKLPPEGLVIDNGDGKRLGVWIMPDNCSRGMLETFLHLIVPEEDKNALWEYAKGVVIHVKTLGSKYRDCHADKALIHTWLGWQDPPGQALGNAIVKKILDPQSPNALPFVNWFKKLYQL